MQEQKRRKADSSCRWYLNSIQMPMLDVRCAIHGCEMMHEIEFDNARPNIKIMFSKRDDGPNTRRQAHGNYLIPKCNLNLVKETLGQEAHVMGDAAC